ncbi:MAG: M61 family metallopeptidase, partial [Gammaproteobacteria bacterium]|nr:M61 family metallopeptidase [Gammaproteobacteria bacterium]
GSGYGGLEHRDSCALICSREDLPRVGDESVSEGYRKFLGLCSHEYFHLWNIKKIRPEVFSPYRLDRESYTRQLWAFEGITSYYDDLSLVQCGLITTESYLELLGETLTRLQRNRGQWIQSVTDSSLDAWSKFYQQDENANNAIVSYYTKGAIIALMIDLYLRQQSSGQVTLQQVMQPLWERYGKQGRGVPETLIEQLCHQIAGSEIPFLWDALYSTKPLEPAPLLQRMGVESRLRPTTSKKDRGGQWSKKEPLSWLGALLTDTHHALRVDRVTDGGPAQQAGISSGDQIIALDHLQVSESSLQSILYQREPGSKITIHLFRRDELMERVATLVAPPNDTVVLELMAAPTPQQTTLQQQWLHQSDRL